MKCIAALFLVSSFTLAALSADNRNVVLLISDNQNQADCGCYGNVVIKTPNIDQLAREGIRFLDAFATTASCGPSRAVIYTGLLTHRNGQYGHGHGTHTYRLNSTVDTVFKLLSDNGYHTALLGKQHTTPAESYPFTYSKQVSGRDVQSIRDVAREFIAQAGDEPFFLAIGYSEPHPTSRDRPGWGIVHQDDGLPVEEYSTSDVIVPGYLPDQPEVREGLAGYYQQISRLDHGIGLILDLLKDTGNEQNTLVIFTSDHGSSEPGAMANHYEPGIRVPFVVRAPSGGAQPTLATNRAMVTLADITPTILEWTHTPSPNYELDGRSILPILNSEFASDWNEVLLSHVCHEVTMYYPMRTIRNRRYKLIWNMNWRSEYPLPIDTLNRATWQETIRRGDPTLGKRSVKKFLYRDQIELYDLEKDPEETLNLAYNPEFGTVRDELSTKLVDRLTATADQWLVRHKLPLTRDPRSVSSQQAVIDEYTGYQSIFNGRNLDGWILKREARGGYLVEDGCLVCPAEGGGYLFTEQEYADFSFRFDFRLSKGANNGIAFRSPLVDQKPAYHGNELQILDNLGYERPLQPTQYHGALYDVHPARQGALQAIGEWNSQEVWCRGRRLVVTVNDMVILDFNMDNVTPEKRAAHPGLSRKQGHLGLLGHGDRVEFKNLRVKEL